MIDYKYRIGLLGSGWAVGWDQNWGQIRQWESAELIFKMGGESSKQAGSEKKTLPVALSHPKLATAKIVRPQDDKEPPYVEVVTTVPDEQMFQKWVKSIEFYRQPANAIQTVYLPQSLNFEKKGMCGSSGTVAAKYQIFPFVLNEELANRRKIKQPFLQKELWYLAYVLNCAGAFAHADDRLIGDVRPENIMISEDGEIQVVSLASFFDEDTNFRKTLSTKEKTYLSPQQISYLQEGKDELRNSADECYSIGLTLMSAVLLTDESNLYSGDFTFNKSQYEKQLQSMRSSESISPLLRNLIEGLLHEDPSRRITCREVIEMLKPYEEYIMNLDDFRFNEQQIPADIRHKLGGQSQKFPQNGSYSRVINNNGYHQESLIRSPRGSQAVQYQTSNTFSYPNNSQFHLQPPSQGTTHIRDNSFASSHQNNGVIVTQSVYTPASQYQRPGSAIRHDPPIQQRSFVLSGFNPGHIQGNVYNNPPPPPPPVVRNVPSSSVYPSSYSQGGSYIQSGISPNVSNYGSNVPSYIQAQAYTNPNRQTQQSESYQISQHTYQISQPPQPKYNNLDNIGREATSYHPNKSKDGVFDSYDQVMKKIDKQLNQSRRMFPDEQP